MHRDDALVRLAKLQGTDLRPMAEEYGITVWKNGKINKGWAGHTLERYLGLPLNSARAPNFGSWELKLVPLRRNKTGHLIVKETMAITMIDPHNVKEKSFADSHLLAKLRKAVICAREFESKKETRSILQRIAAFDLDVPEIYQRLEEDYETVRCVLKTEGFDALTGKMGDLVQPRTKGPGHGSTSRAFYARKPFVEYILGLGPLPRKTD